MVRNILFLSCILFWGSPGWLEAYTVTVTPLSDRTFPPIDAKQVVFAGAWDQHQPVANEEDLATITLRFEPQEIGSDNAAAMALGRREAAKLGATSYYWVSGSQRDVTKDIATRTFHLTRPVATASASPPPPSSSPPSVDAQIPAPDDYYREIRSTPFGKLYFEWIETKKNMTPDEKVNCLRIREKKAQRKDVVVTRYFDIKTDKEVTAEEVQRRFILYLDHARPAMIAKNATLYRSDYPRLQKINDTYSVQNPHYQVIDWPTPPPETPAPNIAPALPHVM